MSLASTVARLAVARAQRWSFERASARGRRLGRLVWHLDARHRRVALANLARAFPEHDHAWRLRIARASFEQAGRSIVELLWSPRLPEIGLPAAVEPDGTERIAQALAGGRGAILASGHFGNWELIGLALGMLGVPLVSIARPLDDNDLDAMLVDLRTRTGNAILPKSDAVRGALRALRKGKAVAVLADQNTLRHEAIFVPYFGRLAATTPVISHLHLRSGAPVLPTFAVPERDRYRLLVEPPLDLDISDRASAVEKITAAVTARIEYHVRACPEAWLWMHDRWRERPEEDPCAGTG